MQRLPELNDGNLLEILRQKDSQIVGMESINREKQRDLDLRLSELEKLQAESNVYKDLIEVNNVFCIVITSIWYVRLS